MLTVGTYNPNENGYNSAKALASLQGLYESFRAQMSKLLILFLMFAVGLPILVFWGFWFKAKRGKFQKNMRNNPEFKSPSNYYDFRVKLDRMNEFKPRLEKIMHYNVKRAPWPVKFTLKKMQNMSSTLLTYSGWQELQLSGFNKTQFKSKSPILNFASEKELWTKRNKAYTYWM